MRPRYGNGEVSSRSRSERGGERRLAASVVVFSLEDLTDQRPEPWEIVSNDFPYEFQIDSEILVDQDVSQTCDLAPFDLRVRSLDLLGEPLRELGQGLQAPQDRFAGLGVVEENIASGGRVASDAIDAPPM